MFLPANVVCSVVQTAVIVGGLAPEKQRRLLRKRPDIIIATPGRLWELIQEVQWHSTLLFSVVKNTLTSFLFSHQQLDYLCS